MAHIKVTKGLDIPISGKPSGSVQPLSPGGEPKKNNPPKTLSLNLDPFEGIRFKLLAKRGDRVKIGQPLVEDKLTEGRVFTSPAGGVVSEVRRGLKRRLIDIVIQLDGEEQVMDHGALDVGKATREQLIDLFMRGGLFARIRQRPFNRLADPKKTPRNI